MKKNTSVYVNLKTKRVHDASKNLDRCRQSQIRDGNKKKFGSLEEAQAAGFAKLCGHCFPQGVTGEVHTLE